MNPQTTRTARVAYGHHVQKAPMVTTIDPSETYPLYLRCVEYARGIANSSNASGLSYKEAFNAALIAFAFALGKDSVRQTVRVTPTHTLSDVAILQDLRKALQMIAGADDATYMSSVKEFAKHVLMGGSLADIPAKAIF